jgi:ceramide glucosyltransferase
MSELFDHDLAKWLGELCAAGAVLGCLYNLTAIILVLRFPQARKTATWFPSISILRPLHGNEPGLFSRLSSLFRQDYPGRIEIVCGVQEENDAAMPVVELLRATSPAHVELRVNGREHGSNRKVSNLINMEAAARQEVVVVSDSDIAVDASYVSSVVAELESPAVGAVTCAYHGIAAGGIYARLSAMSINLQFLPNVIAAVSLGAARPCFGATIALRRETLAQIGGFSAAADELADDFALGRAVRALGRQVVVSRFTVGHVCFERDFRSLWARQLRSARTIQTIDPVGYIGTIFMHPLPLSVLAAALGIGSSLLLISAALICRISLSSAIQRACQLPRPSYWLIPVQDALAFAVFVTSFFGSAVEWRGKAYRVAPDGALTERQ